MLTFSETTGHFGGPGAFDLYQQAERILPTDRIVAVALLTEGDLTVLGPTFTRAWPVEDAPIFRELLREIDEAERELERRATENARC